MLTTFQFQHSENQIILENGSTSVLLLDINSIAKTTRQSDNSRQTAQEDRQLKTDSARQDRHNETAQDNQAAQEMQENMTLTQRRTIRQTAKADDAAQQKTEDANWGISHYGYLSTVPTPYSLDYDMVEYLGEISERECQDGMASGGMCSM
jgi:hypothetical protein